MDGWLYFIGALGSDHQLEIISLRVVDIIPHISLRIADSILVRAWKVGQLGDSGSKETSF